MRRLFARWPTLPALALALVAAAPQTGARMHEAKGRFDVELKPAEGPAAGLGRMSIRKTFHGDLEGTSVGEMLTAGSPKAERRTTWP